MILFSVIKEIVFEVIAHGIISLIEYFRRSFLAWLQRIPEMIQDKVDGIVYGAKTFVGNKLGVSTEISENYSYNGQRWQRTTVTRTVDESEIPEEILCKMRQSDRVDVTDELQMEISS